MCNSIEVTLPEHLGKLEYVEELLCLATLIATGTLRKESNLSNAQIYWEDVAEGDCGNCKHYQTCLSCIINN